MPKPLNEIPTPRTDAVELEIRQCSYSAANQLMGKLAWTLERELTAANARIKELENSGKTAEAILDAVNTECAQLKVELEGMRRSSKQLADDEKGLPEDSPKVLPPWTL